MKTTTQVRWVFFAVIGALLALPFGASAWAALYSGYVGNRTDGTGAIIDTAGGMSATGNAWAATGTNILNKGVRLDWSVDSSGGNWVYTYSFTMASGALNRARQWRGREVAAGARRQGRAPGCSP